MVGLVERSLWVPVGKMVPPRSIGAELIAGISDLGERPRPATTFEQSIKSLFPYWRNATAILSEKGFVRVGDILKQPLQEFSFDLVHDLRGRLDNYLKDLLTLPHSRLLEAVYGRPQSPAPADREQEIIDGVEGALNQMKNTRRRAVLIRRYGLYDGITRTLEEIGRIGFGKGSVTKEGIRQLETAGLQSLRYHPRANIKRLLVVPENSFGREAFGAVLEKDLPDSLNGQASITSLRLSSMRSSYPYLKTLKTIENLVMLDLDGVWPKFSAPDKEVIVLSLQKRAAEMEALRAEMQRRARIGEPANSLVSVPLVPNITLTPEQREQLDRMPLQILNLKITLYYDLMRGGIQTVGELLGMSEKQLLAVRNIGVKKAKLIATRLAEFLKS